VLLGQFDKGCEAVPSKHSYGGTLDGNGPGGRRLAPRKSEVRGLKLDTVTYDASIAGFMGPYIRRSTAAHRHRRVRESQPQPADDRGAARACTLIGCFQGR
jgi:hypothetical protein